MKSKFVYMAALVLCLSGTALGKSWLIFYADDITLSGPNQSFTGHAFVSFVKEDPTLQQTVLVGCWGFYPKNGLGVWDEVEGQIRNDVGRQKSIGLMVEVTEAEFGQALAKKGEWAAKKYRLLGNNCVSFLEDIAKQVPKLKIPKGQYLPSSYVFELKSLNTPLYICPNHPDIRDSYSVLEANYHFYTVNYEVCDQNQDPCCTSDMVFEVMANNSSFIAPYAGSLPISDCGAITLPGFGSIVTKIDRPYSITNYTKPNHKLHAGKVTRYVTQVGSKVFVYTVGVGNNKNELIAWVNELKLTTHLIWDSVNEKLREEVLKRLKDKKGKSPCKEADNTALLLMDISGSMLENDKFNQAKQAALSTIGTIQQEAKQTGKVPEVGIMVFSGDCTADPTTIVQPFTTDLTEVVSSIQRIPFPHGSTPLPQAVERAKVALEKRLAETGLPCGNLIVLGDGQSSCGNIRPPNSYIGPPKVKRVCGQKKGAAGANIALFTIGFGIEAGSTAERDLQYLAATSGGKYFNAQDQYQLTRSFQKINRVYTPIAKAQTVSADMGALGWFDAAYDFTVSAQAYDTARLLYKNFIEKYPEDSSGLYNYALLCEANEQYKSAANYYERYLQHAPNDPNRPLLQERINTLRKDYDIFVAYTKRVVQNDLAYLERHYRQLMNTPDAVPLAGEFAGFIQEKQPFYRSLSEVLEMDTPWLKQYAKEIAASLGEATYFLKQPKWDVNGIAMVGNAYLPLTRLVERLKQ